MPNPGHEKNVLKTKGLSGEQIDSLSEGLGNIRVQQSPARAMAQLGAKAFTAGDKISFKGKGDESTSGKSLMAHEAAHVVQQDK